MFIIVQSCYDMNTSYIFLLLVWCQQTVYIFYLTVVWLGDISENTHIEIKIIIRDKVEKLKKLGLKVNLKKVQEMKTFS